jgi:hypothetical protein
MRYSFIVYKKEPFDLKDRGLVVGIVAQNNSDVEVKFRRNYKSLLRSYDKKYDKFILDALPTTLSRICSEKEYTISSAKGGKINTTDPEFLDALRRVYRSKIQITTPKNFESNASNSAEKVLSLV